MIAEIRKHWRYSRSRTEPVVDEPGPLDRRDELAERRTRAFLAASNSRGRRINAFRTDNERAAAARERPAA